MYYENLTEIISEIRIFQMKIAEERFVIEFNGTNNVYGDGLNGDSGLT